MNTRLIVIALCLSLCLSTPGILAQGNEAQSWEALGQIPVGENLQIERRDGKESSGKLVSYSDFELLLRTDNNTESFNRNDVTKVWLVAPASRTRKALFGGLGAAGGFVAGLWIALSLAFKDCDGSCAEEKTGIVVSLVGLPAAGLFGGIALAGKRRTLIYSAP
jgi:hypothetical protein